MFLQRNIFTISASETFLVQITENKKENFFKKMKHLNLFIFLAVLMHYNITNLHVCALDDGFIKRRGVQLILNDDPYYANGFNAYWMMHVASDPSQRFKIKTAFREAARHGLTVARTWAFSDGGDRPLQVKPGSYNEQMFKGLDYVLAEARANGIKLILSFVNNYDSYGGKKQYVNWARDQGHNIISDDDFFTNSLVKTYYKNHIKAVVDRQNTLTDVGYKYDPTIMAWELMNEPRCASDPSGRTLQAWICEMATYVKSVDHNHLLEVGLEGFYGPSTPQRMFLNPHIHTGTDFIADNRFPEIDFATVHAYPDQWLSNRSNQFQLTFINAWLKSHIEDAQYHLHKPILITEFGQSLPEPGFTPLDRDAMFDAVYSSVYASAKEGGAAACGMFWQLLSNGLDEFQDGYGIVLSKTASIVEIISQQSSRLCLVSKMLAATRRDIRDC